MRCGETLNLDQLLTDPLIKMLMLSDHVDEAEIRTLMRRAHGQEKRIEKSNETAIN